MIIQILLYFQLIYTKNKIILKENKININYEKKNNKINILSLYSSYNGYQTSKYLKNNSQQKNIK